MVISGNRKKDESILYDCINFWYSCSCIPNQTFMLVGDGCLKRAQRQAKLLNIWESNWSNINSISLIRTV